MITEVNLRKSIIAALLALAAMMMLPACSTTDEEGEGGGHSSYDECVAGCGQGDVDCRESCVKQYTP